ncbi:MAG: ThuA domain-containing protein [bacterium]
MSIFHSTSKIKTAVVTGRHPFDLPAFYEIFKTIPEIEFYPQHMEDFVSDAGKVRTQYDVIVFYNFHQETPGNEKNWWDKGTKEALEQLGEYPQGILLLHHAILAFPNWDIWGNICGIKDRKFGFHVNQTIITKISSYQHPIVKGLSDWEMVDETYTMNSAGDDSEIILTTDHPNSMKTLGWVRKYKNSRVFCYQSGHDAQAYNNQNFRTVISRAIQWLAGRI